MHDRAHQNVHRPNICKITITEQKNRDTYIYSSRFSVGWISQTSTFVQLIFNYGSQVKQKAIFPLWIDSSQASYLHLWITWFLSNLSTVKNWKIAWTWNGSALTTFWFSELSHQKATHKIPISWTTVRKK